MASSTPKRFSMSRECVGASFSSCSLKRVVSDSDELLPKPYASP